MLANLFLHYVFDDYMVKEFPSIQWARYADDGIAHCVSLKQAKYLLRRLQERFAKCGLEINLEKTKIVYCKDDDRKGDYENMAFDFLGYSFRPRGAKNKYGKYFTSFLPAISDNAQKAIRKKVREWKLQLKNDKSLQDLANMFNSQIQGWLNYYTYFYKSEIYDALRYINNCLVKWVRKKYKKRKARRKAEHWLGKVARRDTKLFAHWKFGILPAAERWEPDELRGSRPVLRGASREVPEVYSLHDILQEQTPFAQDIYCPRHHVDNGIKPVQRRYRHYQILIQQVVPFVMHKFVFNDKVKLILCQFNRRQ